MAAGMAELIVPTFIASPPLRMRFGTDISGLSNPAPLTKDFRAVLLSLEANE
jgi:hypothetical protein